LLLGAKTFLTKTLAIKLEVHMDTAALGLMVPAKPLKKILPNQIMVVKYALMDTA
jgi:hypothetical protein